MGKGGSLVEGGDGREGGKGEQDGLVSEFISRSQQIDALVCVLGVGEVVPR